VAAASAVGVGSGIINNIVSSGTRDRDDRFSHLHFEEFWRTFTRRCLR
jgi:hypothetical protein